MATDPAPNSVPPREPEWDAWTPRRRRSRRQLSREDAFLDWYGDDDAGLEVGAKLPRAKALGELMDGVLLSLDMGDKLLLRRLVDAWPKLVGPEIARVSAPSNIDRKTLFIEITDTVWMYRLRPELRYLTQRLEEFSEGAIKQVRLVPGGRSASR